MNGDDTPRHLVGILVNLVSNYRIISVDNLASIPHETNHLHGGRVGEGSSRMHLPQQAVG